MGIRIVSKIDKRKEGVKGGISSLSIYVCLRDFLSKIYQLNESSEEFRFWYMFSGTEKVLDSQIPVVPRP